MSHSPESPHTFRTCAPLTQTELATLDQQQRENVEQVPQGQSEFPDLDKLLFLKPFVRARMRARQNMAWHIVKSLADPMLTTVKALGSVRVAELIVSRTLSESQAKYNVLKLLDFRYLVQVDWETKDEAHPGWARINKAIDVVESVVYDVFSSPSNNFGTDLDKSPARRLLRSECCGWLEMDCDLDDTLHLECLQHASAIPKV